MKATPFVGRVREVEILESALRAALDGHGSIVALAGEPGIGKTRLAEEIAARASGAGALVLWGKCWETGGARAFWPWVQVVRTYAREVDERELHEAFGPAWAEVSVIVPELRGETPSRPSVPAIDSEHARFVLFDAMAGCLARAARRRPLVLVLDDLHAADLPSLLLLQFVAKALHRDRVLILGAHREAEVRRRPDAARVIADLARSGTTIPLRGLADGETQHLLSAAFAVEVGASTVATLQTMTGGNPFLIEEVAHVLVAERRIDRLTSLDGASVLPVHARELVRHRLDLLPAPAHETLRVAALIGQEFGLRMLQTVCGLTEGVVLERLREPIADGLVLAAPEGTRYRFVHALVRETLTDELSATERLALHRAVGEAIETVHGPHLEPYFGSLSHHFVRAAPAGDGERAVRYAAAAGEYALRVLAYEDAALHYEGALEALHFVPAPAVERRAELLLGLGTCHLKAADLEGARRAFGEAAAIARTLGRPDLLGRAALGFAPWTAYGRTSDSGARLLEEALGAQGAVDSPLRAELLARLAHVLDGTGARWSRERVIALSREATAIARRVGERRSLARTLFVARWVDWDPASFAERHGMTEEMLAVAQQLDDRDLAVLAAEWQVVDCLELGESADLDAALCTHAALADELRQPEHLWWSAVWRAMRALMEGPSAEAEALVAQAYGIGEGVERDNAYLVSHIQLSQILIDRGQLEGPLQALEAVVAERREILEGDPYLFCRRAEAFVELGREDEARREFERLAADDFASVGFDMRHAVNLASLAVTCAALGDQRRAAVLAERLRPTAGRQLVFGPALLSVGPSSRYQGLLAATMRRYDVAQRHFDDALAACVRLGWEPLAARTRCDQAAALLGRGRRQDRAAARRLLEDAAASADRLGMDGVAMRARSLQEQCADEVRLAGARERPANLWQREGDYWTVAYEGVTSRLRHAAGLAYLAELLRAPAREIHALELVGVTGRDPDAARAAPPAALAVRSSSDGDELLDPEARAAYRGRLRELEAELTEAEEANDPGRAGRLRVEREALESELMRAVGLGGRARRTTGAAERARLNVTRAIRTAIARLDASNPALGRHLMRRVRTGTFCMYLPDPRVAVAWTVVS